MAELRFKLIQPKALNTAQMRSVLTEALHKAALDIQKDFQRTTSTWKHKPAFRITNTSTKDRLSERIETDDSIYTMLSVGTRPHIIRPRNGKVLAFRGGPYTAKSVPGTLNARTGGASGATVTARFVNHPGTAPRHFDQTVAKEWRKKFPDRMQDALNKAAKASGNHYD